MISAIGETAEARQSRWNSLNDFDRDRYKREMEQWKQDYPFCWEVMCGDMTHKELIEYAEGIY